MKKIIYRKHSDFSGTRWYMGRVMNGREYVWSIALPFLMPRTEVAHRLRAARYQLRKIIRRNLLPE